MSLVYTPSRMRGGQRRNMTLTPMGGRTCSYGRKDLSLSPEEPVPPAIGSGSFGHRFSIHLSAPFISM